LAVIAKTQLKPNVESERRKGDEGGTKRRRDQTSI